MGIPILGGVSDRAPNEGFATWSSQPPPMEPVEVIVDNAELDAGFVIQGDWSSSVSESAYNGTFELHAPGTTDHIARFLPRFPVEGTYDVYAHWVANPNRASDAPYTIQHADGITTVRVDQRVDGGHFNLLGTFAFVAGGRGYVDLSANANGFVVADAVRFVLVE